MDVVLMNVTVVCFVLFTGMSASVSRSRSAYPFLLINVGCIRLLRSYSKPELV